MLIYSTSYDNKIGREIQAGSGRAIIYHSGLCHFCLAIGPEFLLVLYFTAMLDHLWSPKIIRCIDPFGMRSRKFLSILVKLFRYWYCGQQY